MLLTLIIAGPSGLVPLSAQGEGTKNVVELVVEIPGTRTRPLGAGSVSPIELFNEGCLWDPLGAGYISPGFFMEGICVPVALGDGTTLCVVDRIVLVLDTV